MDDSNRQTWRLEAVLALATQPYDFTSGELATQVQQRLGDSPLPYQARQAGCDLKKLCGKHGSYV